MMIMPSCFAVHRLSDGRWEILAPDDDPRRPPWRHIGVFSYQPPPFWTAPFPALVRASNSWPRN
jgi:hypothetical protein